MRYRQLNDIVSCVDNIHEGSLFVGVAVEGDNISNSIFYGIDV
ncbi:hypothetical protein XBKB1_3770005 [Xenorhabdus bovienii str. kraussei Becker Underwood]|uniref:Uncharacterized protein n=1 Tax=Xenorhabdus bovienii str. kraussei Becker Underwood TaxID=1398204 RepID=A0A077PZF2_XENBV|nr:hypothetical protein XBKB1_3770005 [Xenorhabdus bovienii str. kraussei Becker Underwood]